MLNKELLLSGSEAYPEYTWERATACFTRLGNGTYIHVFRILKPCCAALCYSHYDYFLASHYCVKYPSQKMSEAIVLGGNGGRSTNGNIIVSTTPGYEDWYVWRVQGYDAGGNYTYYTNENFGTADYSLVKAWVYLPKGSFLYQIRDNIYQGRRGTESYIGFDRVTAYQEYSSGSNIDLDNIDNYSPNTSYTSNNRNGWETNWNNGLYETYGPSSKPNSVILSI